MGRKKLAPATTAPVEAPATATPQKEMSASAIVREILDSGIVKPAEIETIAKEKYHVAISKPSINQAKMQWKKKGGTAGKVNKAPRAKAITEQRGGNGLTELDVAKFALKMGGVDAAVRALQNLVK